MNDEEIKKLAYIALMVLKLSRGERLDGNEEQSLQNIAEDLLHFAEIDEEYFRY